MRTRANTRPPIQLRKFRTSIQAAGSPFGAGGKFAYAPQYKPTASIQGTTSSRVRVSCCHRPWHPQTRASSQPVNSYRTSSSSSNCVLYTFLGPSAFRNMNGVYGIGAVGLPGYRTWVVHSWSPQAPGPGLGDVPGGGDMGDHFIYFTATLDPNGDGVANCLRYTPEYTHLRFRTTSWSSSWARTAVSRWRTSWTWPHRPHLMCSRVFNRYLHRMVHQLYCSSFDPPSVSHHGSALLQPFAI